MRPFKTPLAEVSAQIDLATADVVEFRAHSFYELIKEQYPRLQRLPVILVPDPTSLQNLHLPAYRFFSDDGNSAIQIGPRMMTINSLTWDLGYEAYRHTAFETMKKFCDVVPNELVAGYSLGFYNRVPASDLGEARSIFRLQLQTDEAIAFDELSYQSVRNIAIGSVLMQVAVAQPDERMPEKHLLINNIVRRTLGAGLQPLKDIEQDWQSWFDAAHDIAKEIFWNSLTPEAQNSWKTTAPA